MIVKALKIAYNYLYISILIKNMFNNMFFDGKYFH